MLNGNKFKLKLLNTCYIQSENRSNIKIISKMCFQFGNWKHITDCLLYVYSRQSACEYNKVNRIVNINKMHSHQLKVEFSNWLLR